MTTELLITLGDPLGIGSEVVFKALRQLKQANVRFVLIGSQAHHLPMVRPWLSVLKQKNVVWREVTAEPHKNPKIQAGRLSIACLETAFELLHTPKTQALVTAPISKTHIGMAGFAFPGHTEFLCQKFHVKNYAMMLFCNELRIVLLTIHKPLRDIFTDITAGNIKNKLTLTYATLKNDFGLTDPKVAVCGLNPHASEGSRFGSEEEKIVIPAIKAWKKQNPKSAVFGPISADTVFHRARQGKFDAVICHYHDQGLIPIKTVAFDSAVNMTLGLPFLRTSPDHGTAFDIAGKSLASESSLLAALKASIHFLKQRGNQ